MSEWYSDRTWLQSPRHIVSAAVVASDSVGRLLLVRSPMSGWEMPGGQVEIGESLVAAAIRETKEESGIDVTDLVFCGVFQNTRKSIVNVLFRGRSSGGVLRTSVESVEAGFFERSAALELVTYDNFRQRIEYCLDVSRQPFFVV